jgi:hypothetical protein
MATSARLLINGLYPKKCWYTVPDIASMLAQFICHDVIPNEDCRVVVLLCRSTSHLTGSILSRSVIIQSHCHTNTSFIHTLYTHSYMHNTFIPTCIKAFIHTYIQHANKIIHTWLHWPSRVLLQLFHKKSHPQCVSFKDVSIKHISQKSHPSVSGPEMPSSKIFQVAGFANNQFAIHI